MPPILSKPYPVRTKEVIELEQALTTVIQEVMDHHSREGVKETEASPSSGEKHMSEPEENKEGSSSNDKEEKGEMVKNLSQQKSAHMPLSSCLCQRHPQTRGSSWSRPFPDSIVTLTKCGSRNFANRYTEYLLVKEIEQFLNTRAIQGMQYMFRLSTITVNRLMLFPFSEIPRCWMAPLTESLTKHLGNILTVGGDVEQWRNIETVGWKAVREALFAMYMDFKEDFVNLLHGDGKPGFWDTYFAFIYSFDVCDADGKEIRGEEEERTIKWEQRERKITPLIRKEYYGYLS